ncbi:protein kri1 [Triticum urartu]|uniref:protein kri1 n=1 Tax=Triticum urartu TaxID=4572 RepID=UPI0020440C3C|nr:protein kri1 [Triticum urartu]
MSGEGEGEGERRVLDILAGSDDDSDGPAEDYSNFQIDEGYARRYEHKKRREALDRLKEKKKEALVADPDDEDDDDSDDESDEDEAVAAASRRVDRRVLQVIRRIRSGDSAIFDKDAKVYSSSEDEDEDGAEGEPKEGKKAKKERPLYLKDVNAQHLLEEGPEFAAQAGRGSKYDRIAYNELQREGLKEFLEAEKKALGDGDDEEEDLFKAKQAEGDGGDSEEDEDEKQTEELLGEVFGDDDKLDDNEKFLKNYILNRPYLEPAPEKFSLDDIQEVSQEEDVIETQEDYEDIYNKLGNYKFRHEEVEASEGVVTDRVMGHPRVVEGSVRKKESSRKKQRKSKEERLARAKQEQAEELKHLKNLKKKEIAEKLEKIRMIAGIEGEAACKLGADDLEEDFDPEDYDRKMQEMFDDSYYGADEVDPGFGSGDDLDLVKPDFDKEDELLGLPKDWAPDGKEGSTATGEKKKKKKKNKELANGEEEGEKKKGKISLKDKVELEKELDEYYKLDYEDTIGDLKTRFKYRQVQPNSFGLETYEILQSDDRDLNQYVSMKKLAPYREDEWQVTHHKKLSKDLILGGQKIEGKKVKSHKKSKSGEGPSSGRPETDKPTSEQEETDGKTESKSKKHKTGKRSRSEDGPGSEKAEEVKLTSEQEDADAKTKSKKSKKAKTGKEPRSEEDPSSGKPEEGKLTSEEETGGKKKSTRSERRNRRRKELKISRDRQGAYGLIDLKSQKSN